MRDVVVMSIDVVVHTRDDHIPCMDHNRGKRGHCYECGWIYSIYLSWMQHYGTFYNWPIYAEQQEWGNGFYWLMHIAHKLALFLSLSNSIWLDSFYFQVRSHSTKNFLTSAFIVTFTALGFYMSVIKEDILRNVILCPWNEEWGSKITQKPKSCFFNFSILFSLFWLEP